MPLLFIRLALRNVRRQRLRSALTAFGLVVAVLAFGLLRTLADAWYAGVDAAAANRVIVRNAVSIIVPLPLGYRSRIAGVEGVKEVSYGNFFMGIYINERNLFPQFAIDGKSFFKVYPEFVVDEKGMRAFLADRRGAVAGYKLAKRFGWKIGDIVPMKGTIYPGDWSFVLRAIYHGRDRSVDETQFFFHFDYINERLRREMPDQADKVGIYFATIDPPEQAAQIARRIDALFANSLAETMTETEKAFQLSFVAMTDAILKAVEIVSFVVIGIILVVMVNTMAMSARERGAEYATLRTLGFPPAHIAGLILLESMALALIGGGLGMLLTAPASRILAVKLSDYLPVFNVSPATYAMQAAAVLVVGLAAGALPAFHLFRLDVVEGLRAKG